jgi:hypothetical protein
MEKSDSVTRSLFQKETGFLPEVPFRQAFEGFAAAGFVTAVLNGCAY